MLKKRFLSLGLALVMSASALCVPALAADLDAVDLLTINQEHTSDLSKRSNDNLVSEISRFISDFVVPLGSMYALNDCGEIQLGMVIPTYSVEERFSSQGHFESAEVQYYPVFSEERVVGLVGIALDEDGNYVFSYSEGYAEQINSVLADHAEIALIGNGRSLETVACSEQAMRTYSALNFVNPSEELSTITVTTDTEAIARSSNSPVVLQVPVKLQSKNWDCWAACVACVGQYYTGINKSSIQVADAVGIHKATGVAVACDALQSVYHVSAAYQTGALTISGVMYTISNNRKPILAGMIHSGKTGHMIVINGWTLVGSQMAVMFMDPDPTAGSTVATVSGNSPITLPLNGYMYTMQEYVI